MRRTLVYSRRAEAGSESAALFSLGRERASQWLRFFAALHRTADDAKALQVLILAFRVNVASRQVHKYRICRSWGPTVYADHSQRHVFSLAPCPELLGCYPTVCSGCLIAISNSHAPDWSPGLKPALSHSPLFNKTSVLSPVAQAKDLVTPDSFWSNTLPIPSVNKTSWLHLENLLSPWLFSLFSPLSLL